MLIKAGNSYLDPEYVAGLFPGVGGVNVLFNSGAQILVPINGTIADLADAINDANDAAFEPAEDDDGDGWKRT